MNLMPKSPSKGLQKMSSCKHSHLMDAIDCIIGSGPRGKPLVCGLRILEFGVLPIPILFLTFY